MNQRRWNWLLWAGFLLCLAGFATFPFFARFPFTRDVPWVNFLLLGAGLALLVLGLKRAFSQPQQYREKSQAQFWALSVFWWWAFSASSFSSKPGSCRPPTEHRGLD